MSDTVQWKQANDRLIYAAAIVVSFALSLWGAYSQPIPNPDGALYLRSAELFSIGQWEQGAAIYRWPFYSLCIAFVMFVTGLGAPPAAQVVNALFDCGTAVLFIALVRRLAADGEGRRLAGWAAFIILLHPRMIQLRPMVIRDHGFYAFVLLTLYLVVRDHQFRQNWIKPAIAASIVAATLFRSEALLLAVVVPLFYLYEMASPFRRRVLILPMIVLVCAGLVLAYAIWTSAALLPATAASGLRQDLTGRLQDVFTLIADRASQLKEVLPPGRNTGIVAYVGIVLAGVLEVVLRALTIPIAILAVFAFTPRRLMTDFATRFVLWFAGWQLPLLLTFMTLAFFLDQRFAVVLTLLLTIPAAFTIAALADEWRQRIPRARYLLPIAMLAVIIPWIINLPRSTKLEYLRDAGHWINRNTAPGARVVTNDPRVAYYSGRMHEGVVPRGTPDVTESDVASADYLAVEVDRGRIPAFVTQDLQSRLVATINGLEGRQVLVYRTR